MPSLMLLVGLDLSALTMVVVGAAVAGFITGFAGFGAVLVVAGLWYHALPAEMVPPLGVLASIGAQLVGLPVVRDSFDWPRSKPYLAGGLAGIPFGIWALTAASPELLRTSVGVFLIGYSLFQLRTLSGFGIGSWGGRAADAAIGAAGGFLGGFAGLSGPVPLIWLQLRGGPSVSQRAVYQPFNLVVMVVTGIGMVVSGVVDLRVAALAALCMPATLGGAWVGVRAYGLIDEQGFRRAVLTLLLLSGAVLVVQFLFD
jgi:uncharacterized membrane protein YfcA